MPLIAAETVTDPDGAVWVCWADSEGEQWMRLEDTT